MFEKSGKPALVISTLEALAVLVSLKIFRASGASVPRSGCTHVDRQSGERISTQQAHDDLMMEMAAFLKKNSIRASVQWASRTANREADALANGRTEDFSPEYKQRLDPTAMDWILLERALEMGRAAEEQFREFKASGRSTGSGVKAKRRRPERLRIADPW